MVIRNFPIPLDAYRSCRHTVAVLAGPFIAACGQGIPLFAAAVAKEIVN